MRHDFHDLFPERFVFSLETKDNSAGSGKVMRLSVDVTLCLTTTPTCRLGSKSSYVLFVTSCHLMKRCGVPQYDFHEICILSISFTPALFTLSTPTSHFML
jgi:hypothetical protein